MNKTEFLKTVSSENYPAPEIREWESDLNGPMHVHEKSVMLLVTRGELTLVFEDGPRRFQIGDCCTLPANTLHAEQTGAEGATTLLTLK